MKMSELHDKTQNEIREKFKAEVVKLQDEVGGTYAIAEGLLFDKDIQDRIIEAAVHAVG